MGIPIYFIHSSFDGYLDCFSFFLAIMNIDAVGNSVYKLLQGYIFSSLGMYLGIELLDHIQSLCV